MLICRKISHVVQQLSLTSTNLPAALSTIYLLQETELVWESQLWLKRRFLRCIFQNEGRDIWQVSASKKPAQAQQYWADWFLSTCFAEETSCYFFTSWVVGFVGLFVICLRSFFPKHQVALLCTINYNNQRNISEMYYVWVLLGLQPPFFFFFNLNTSKDCSYLQKAVLLTTGFVASTKNKDTRKYIFLFLI